MQRTAITAYLLLGLYASTAVAEIDNFRISFMAEDGDPGLPVPAAALCNWVNARLSPINGVTTVGCAANPNSPTRSPPFSAT